MSLSNNFPAIAPSLSLDFANTKRLDPRITFTRTTTATYYDGVTTAKAEENLFLQSQAFNATWVPFDDVLTGSQTAPDGTSTAWSLAQESGTTASARIQQTPSVVAADYVISIFAKADTRDFLAIQEAILDASTNITWFNLSTGAVGTTNADHTATITSVGSGWYRCSIKFTVNAARSGAVLFRACDTDGNTAAADDGTGIFIWGAQLEQRSAVSSYTPTTTQAITNYIPALQTAASGVARFDHNPTTGESLGLLVEEQRTNLCLQSEDLSTTWTTAAASVTTNIDVAPDGTLTADRIIADTTNAFHGVNQSIAVVTGTAYTFSVYAKAYGNNFLRIGFSSARFSNALAYFDLSTGSVGTVTGGTATITLVGNGWYRCAFTATCTSTGTSSHSLIYTSQSDNQSQYTGDGWSGLLAWGSQFEAGAFPTSYIATTSASVTRNADVASMTGTNFSSWYRADEGTLYAESRCPNGITGNINRIASLNDGTTSNRIELDTGEAAATVVRNVVNGTSQGAPTAGSFTDFQLRKSALAIQVDNFTLAANTSTASDTSALVPVVNRLMIGQSTASNSSYLNGTMAKLAFYPARLTNAQLQALTS